MLAFCRRCQRGDRCTVFWRHWLAWKEGGKAERQDVPDTAVSLRTIPGTSFLHHPTPPFRSYIRLLSSCCLRLSSSSYENTSNMGLVRGGIRGSLHRRELVPEQVPKSSKEVVSIHSQAVGRMMSRTLGISSTPKEAGGWGWRQASNLNIEHLESRPE